MQSQKAFSLFELLITLGLITITATLTVPNFKTFLIQAETQTLRTQLQRALAYARSQAMLRGVKVTLCGASKNHQQCAPDWTEGILIFTDASGDATITNPNQILHVITTPAQNGQLHWRSSFKVNYLQIQASGATNGENGTYWYCARNAPTASWALVINLAGRARMVSNDGDLKKLTCS
jgi:type IV fimbrial biogenesis protein FimT